MTIKPSKTINIGIFTSASNSLDPKYYALAKDLGQLLGSLGHTIIYGGAGVGMMGALADGALEKRGCVIGVLPKSLASKEIAHANLSQLHLTETLHERKKIIYDLSEIFLTLPGGFGTLDETFEVLTWNQLGHFRKPLYFYNIDGFFDQLLKFINQLEQHKFIKVYDSISVHELKSQSTLLNLLTNMRATS